MRLKLLYSTLLCISGLAACRPDIHVSAGQKRYFDLAKFIHTDSARLSKAQTAVLKTVVQNNSAPQTKRIKITNWGQELNLFAASDINKPAWRDSYKIVKGGDSVVYTALQQDLTTRRMVVYGTPGKVKKISVDNFTKNMLYQTTEHLVYYPDSLYEIDKLQKVRFIGSNRYLIIGKIK
ncbi:hypothetical protein ABDD95_13325 [Mucilaginibacter sp. PAMB04274]|uniref:hypothetical protein n=1 Tax=Mucilaginibacter sp. PAMB04274 TaxID=3138568 RepID=UPI0031F6B947